MKNISDEEIILYVFSKLNKIKGKKAFQKIIYFLEENGIPLGYSYRWWIYGPYSRELDIDLRLLIFENKVDYITSQIPYILIKKNSNEILLPHTIKNKIDSILSELNTISNNMEPLKLELAASIHFILNTLELTETEKINEVKKIIKRRKNEKFTDNEIQDMYYKLKNSKLFSKNN